MSEVLALTSQTPITFYGKVVDQHGNPVVGAQVRGNAEMVKRWMSQEWDTHFTTTDIGGRFRFTGLHGQSLVVSPAKEGYEYKSNHVAYEYAMVSEKDLHHPDPSAPVVFTMWKQQGPEPLVHFDYARAALPVNGTPISFDLLTGKKLPAGGDLVLTLERQPEHIQRGQRFDWKAILEVPSGGVAEVGDAYPNEAPADGYDAQFVIDMPANSKDWQSSVTRNFYVKARGGKLYARITLRITADYEPPPTGVTMEAFVNPSGSRNLEYDPLKTVISK